MVGPTHSAPSPAPGEVTMVWERALEAPGPGYSAWMPSRRGVFVDQRQVIDLATGAGLWTLPPCGSPGESPVMPWGGQNWGFFGEDLVAFKPVPGAGLTVTGYHPRTGLLRRNIPHSRVSGNVWGDQAHKEPYLAASVDGNNDPCREWTFIDPHRDRLAWRTPASTEVGPL